MQELLDQQAPAKGGKRNKGARQKTLSAGPSDAREDTSGDSHWSPYAGKSVDDFIDWFYDSELMTMEACT